VFIGEILANMTQVSDVAPGPLVSMLSMDIFYSVLYMDNVQDFHENTLIRKGFHSKLLNV
jgi:hypothetical protein